MKIGSLSEKLILYFVLLGIGAIMIVSSVAFYSTRQALMSRTFDQLTSLRIVKKSQIEQFYADRIRDLEFLSGTIHLAGNHASTGNGQQHFHERKPAVEGFQALGQYFTSCYILDKNGVLVAEVHHDSLQVQAPQISPQIFSAIRRELLHKPVVICDESVDAQTGSPYQLIAAEMTGSAAGASDRAGIMVLAISIDAINAIMLNNDPKSGLGLSGETYLAGPDFKMRSTSRFQKNSIMRTVVKTSPAIEAVEGKSGVIETKDYRGIPVLSSFGRINVPGLKWVILAEIDVQEAMVPIYGTLMKLMLLSAIIILVFFGFVLFISRRITKPLMRLKDATVNLGEGQYDIDLPVTTSDEIGMLTTSFNVMARQIKEKTTELQQERFGRMRSVFDGEELERQRLSRELHDGIGQSLIAIKLRIENLLYLEGRDMRNSIQELKKYFDQIIDEVRRISNNLMPSVLEVFSIPIAFRNLFSETGEHSGLRIHFEAKGDFDDLDKKIKTYIYRLMQEALNNIVKHAEAREVHVSLTREPDQLILVIMDDGRGFSMEKVEKAGGNGIHNMRERASLLQGRIRIISAPSKGTTITLNVPIINIYVKNQDFPRG